MSCLSLSIDCNKAKGHRIALLPLEVIKQAPMAVALDVDTVVYAFLNTCESAADKLASAAVIRGSNAVFGDKDFSLEVLCHGANNISDRLGVKLVVHLCHLRILWRLFLPEETKFVSCIILNAKEIIILYVGKIVSKLSVPFLRGVLLSKFAVLPD